MEFVVNENGCQLLTEDMQRQMSTIMGLVSEIEGQNNLLHGALGEDYEAIAKSVRTMTDLLNSAAGELNVIIRDMTEYMARVHQARVSLN